MKRLTGCWSVMDEASAGEPGISAAGQAESGSKLRFKNPELTAVGEKVARLNIAIRSKEADLHK